MPHPAHAAIGADPSIQQSISAIFKLGVLLCTMGCISFVFDFDFITSILAIATGALIVDNFHFDFATVVGRWDGRQQQAFCGAVRNVRPLLIATAFFAFFGVAWNLLAIVIFTILPVAQGISRKTDGSSVAWLTLGVLLDLGDAAVAVTLLSHLNA